MTHRYSVHVEETVILTRTIEVEAASVDEAKQKAKLETETGWKTAHREQVTVSRIEV